MTAMKSLWTYLAERPSGGNSGAVEDQTNNGSKPDDSDGADDQSQSTEQQQSTNAPQSTDQSDDNPYGDHGQGSEAPRQSTEQPQSSDQSDDDPYRDDSQGSDAPQQTTDQSQSTDQSEDDPYGDVCLPQEDSAPAPSAEEQKQAQNVEEGKKQFGSSGAKFEQLKGAKELNPRQKQIFDDKLKQAIEKDPRAKSGALSENDLKELAQQAADVSTKLAETPLVKDVNDLAKKSATLKDSIVKLQNEGWTIVVGEAGKGSTTRKRGMTITIDPSQSTKDIVEALAHETGHANFTKPADPSVDDASATIAKGKEYIRKVVENSLIDEGEAQIAACKTAAELEAKGETGINIPGQRANSAKYKAVYAKIVAGTLTTDVGRKEMAKIMATESTSNSSENYIDYYSKRPRKNWNDNHADAQVPETPRIEVFK